MCLSFHEYAFLFYSYVISQCYFFICIVFLFFKLSSQLFYFIHLFLAYFFNFFYLSIFFLYCFSSVFPVFPFFRFFSFFTLFFPLFSVRLLIRPLGLALPMSLPIFSVLPDKVFFVHHSTFMILIFSEMYLLAFDIFPSFFSSNVTITKCFFYAFLFFFQHRCYECRY